MSKLHLSLAILANERTRPIISGEVAPEGVDLTVTVAQSGGEIFWRQLHFGDFDIAEMSVSDMLMLVSRGDSDWVMLPVFTTRRFFHTAVLVRDGAGIDSPADLRGKRVSLQEYVQTAHVWTRGILAEEWGVAPEDMHWFQERARAMSHCHYFGIAPPPPRFDYVAPETSIGEMMLAGELDAVLSYPGRANLMDRSTANLRASPKIRPLFAKPRAEQLRYFTKTGRFPVNHAPVIRRALVERHPWLALNLYLAFSEAKSLAQSRTLELADTQLGLGRIDADTRAALALDAYPYGVAANREVLETCARYSLEQGLSARKVALDELFAEQLMHF